MREQLEKIREEALNQIEASEALEKLNEIRVAYLGKKGELTNLLKEHEECGARGPAQGRPDGKRGPGAAGGTGWRRPRPRLARKAREEQLKREVIDVTLPGQEEQGRATAIPTPSHWKRWSGSSWVWATR